MLLQILRIQGLVISMLSRHAQDVCTLPGRGHCRSAADVQSQHSPALQGVSFRASCEYKRIGVTHLPGSLLLALRCFPTSIVNSIKWQVNKWNTVNAATPSPANSLLLSTLWMTVFLLGSALTSSHLSHAQGREGGPQRSRQVGQIPMLAGGGKPSLRPSCPLRMVLHHAKLADRVFLSEGFLDSGALGRCC